MKYFVLILFAWVLPLDAASLAICVDSKSEDDRPYFKVVWSIEIPPDRIAITKAKPGPSDITISVGGHAQDFSPNADILIEIGKDDFGHQVIDAVRAHPSGHLVLIQDRSIVGMIKTEVQEGRDPKLESHIEAENIRFRVPKWRIQN
jgi:hypothetical protein